MSEASTPALKKPGVLQPRDHVRLLSHLREGSEPGAGSSGNPNTDSWRWAHGWDDSSPRE